MGALPYQLVHIPGVALTGQSRPTGGFGASTALAASVAGTAITVSAEVANSGFQYGVISSLQTGVLSGVIVARRRRTAPSVIFDNSFGNYTASKFGLIIDLYNSQIRLLHKDTAQLVALDTGGPVGEICQIAWSYNNATGAAAIACNGKLATATVTSSPTFNQVATGGYWADFSGGAGPVEVYAQAVANAEQKNTSALVAASLDAWSLFQRKTSRIYFFPSAGGGGATITPTGLSSSAFGSFSVNAGDRILTFTGKASNEAFGAFNLRARNLVSFTGKASDGAFGSFNVYPGKVIILPNSKTTDSVFGTHSLLSGQKIISPSAKTSDEAFGSFIIVSGDRILLMNGVASNEAFGTFSVNNNTANQTILTSGYFDSAFGSFSLRPDQYIIFEGKEYGAFGQFLLSGSAVVRAMHFFDWVSQQPGLRGSMNDKLYQYLIAQGFTGSTPTMLFLWLRSLGYAGNTATMLTAFERDYTTRWH